MAKKLELTPEREAIIAQAREEWRAVGLSTEPADYEAAEAAIGRLYELNGLKRPQFLRSASPMAAELYLNLVGSDQLEGQLGGQLWDQLWDQLRGQLWDQLRGQLGGQLGGQLRGQLRDQLWDQLRGQLEGQLGGQLRGQLWDQLRGQLQDQLWDQLGGQLRGQLEGQLRGQLSKAKLRFMGTWFAGSWDAWIWGRADTGRRLGAHYPDDISAKLDAHCAISRSCGWFYPFKEFCIITDRPELMRFDDVRRLHCENGPALRYRDGYAMYAWRGNRVPSKWIEDKESLAPEIALTHESIEMRRVAAEIIGWDKVLQKLSSKTIDKDEDPMIGELLEVEIPDIGKEKFLRVLCGTGRTFAIPVPPEMKTALEANSWSYGLEPDILKQLEVRT